MELIIPCFVAVGEINIGSEAIERGSSFGAPTTLINKDNPATSSGKITSIDIYASLTGDLVNCEIATFYRPDPISFPNKFTTRDIYNIGAVTGGSKQTFEISLDAEKGDYIGITFTNGSIEYSPVGSGYLGVWSKGGDNIPCTDVDFGTIISGATVSLFAGQPGVQQLAEANCTLLVNEHDNDYFGVMVDCDVDVVRDRVEVCLMPTIGLGEAEAGKPAITSRSIRLVVTIDGEDVTNALTETITIRHALNEVSSFSLTLIDSQYSPLVNPHIDIDVVVVITAFIDGKEFKVFKGLVDTPKTKRTKDFKLKISGRGYGRKLLDKRATLISIQDSAQSTYRGSLVYYLAGQAGITNVYCPKGDKIITDHSFQDQKIWDMVQKECEIEGWYVRCDEQANMLVKIKAIKANPDWTYGEGEFVELGFNKTSKGIINQVVVLGAIFEEEIVTVIPVEEAPAQEIDVPEPEYSEDSVTINKSFGLGEVVANWSYNDGNFKVTASYIGYTKPLGWMFPKYQDYKFTVRKLNSDISYKGSIEFTVVSEGTPEWPTIKYWEGRAACNVHRGIETGTGWPPSFTEAPFSIAIVIKYQEEISGGATWITENLPAEEEANRIETIVKYTQVKATVQDAASIAKYGERKPREQYVLNRPLAETEEQCKRVGENKIKDTHRYTKQPDILVNYNPLLTIGQTVRLYDTKIGYNGENWLVEEIIHTFSIDSETGAIKPRTRAGSVFYA